MSASEQIPIRTWQRPGNTPGAHLRSAMDLEAENIT
jgi:hypothetical protein